MHQKAKITEHMLEFGWGEGWGIKLIWLTWWNSLLLRCEPLPCHEALKKRGPNKSQVRKLLPKSSMGEALGGWGIAHLIQIWDSAEPLPWFPLAVIYGSLGCARRWDPLKKQGEGIIIARGEKKASRNQTLLWARKKTRVWIWAARAWVMYSPTEICSSPIRPLIPNDLSEGEQMQQIRNE